MSYDDFYAACHVAMICEDIEANDISLSGGDNEGVQ